MFPSSNEQYCLFFNYTGGSLFHFGSLFHIFVNIVSVTCPVTVSIMSQKIIFIIFLIQTISKIASFLKYIYMPLDSTSITKITVKKWLYLLNALFVFDGTLKIEKTNFLT